MGPNACSLAQRAQDTSSLRMRTCGSGIYCSMPFRHTCKLKICVSWWDRERKSRSLSPVKKKELSHWICGTADITYIVIYLFPIYGKTNVYMYMVSLIDSGLDKHDKEREIIAFCCFQVILFLTTFKWHHIGHASLSFFFSLSTSSSGSLGSILVSQFPD